MDAHRSYRFGDFTLDLRRGALLKGDAEVALRPKSFDVLRLLLERRGELVTKEELLATVWRSRVVTDGAVTQCLIDIRRAINDDAHAIVRTVPRRGYVFAAPVSTAPSVPPHAPPVDAGRFHPDLEEQPQLRVQPEPPLAEPAVLQSVGHRTSHRVKRPALWGTVLVLLLAALLWPRSAPLSPGPATVASSGGVTAATPLADGDGGAGVDRHVAGAPGAAPAAREAYVRARFFFHRRMAGDLERARLAYMEALRLDPEFAPAWAGLAGVYRAQVGEPGADVPALMRQRRDAIGAALRLDPGLAEAHLRAAAYYDETGNPARAMREASTAVELAPDDPAILAWRADRLAREGRLDEAVTLKRRVLESDPLSLISRVNLANDLLAAGRLDEARVEFRRALEIDPTSAAAIGVDLARILLLEGRHAEALAQASGWPGGVDRDFVLALAHGALQQRDDAAAAIARLRADADAGAAVRLAELHAYRGDPDEAFRWLGVAYDRLGPGARFSAEWQWLYHLRYSPFLRTLQPDPRWAVATQRAEQLGVWRSPERPAAGF